MLGTALNYPGQYFDQETGLNYNWNRYYTPELGRYLQPDPLGLKDYDNLYPYVGLNPLRYTDPMGLEVWTCKHALGQKPTPGNVRSGPEATWNPVYHQYSCVVRNGQEFACGGQCPTSVAGAIYGPGGPCPPERDYFNPQTCERTREDDWCYEGCLIEEWGKPRPAYGGFGPGTQCQEYDRAVRDVCKERCGPILRAPR